MIERRDNIAALGCDKIKSSPQYMPFSGQRHPMQGATYRRALFHILSFCECELDR
jgi:hypothetical protein